MPERQTTIHGKRIERPMECLGDECPEMLEVFPEGGGRRDVLMQFLAERACDKTALCILAELKSENDEEGDTHAS